LINGIKEGVIHKVEEISIPLNFVSSQLFSLGLRKYSKISKEKKGHAIRLSQFSFFFFVGDVCSIH